MTTSADHLIPKNSEATCKGSFNLGNACGKCSKCKAEISKMGNTLSDRDKMIRYEMALEAIIASNSVYRIVDIAETALGRQNET
jgi:hypothetical protein